ncbi:hypothetical protein [Roseimaritima ulvae]|uniref:Uncharacterized protein n=1 Tax=Roseimaritima ulvae TaxID=980254 RepID=A0A5B9R266_9BACT|nr:hypothetical protein [Roseimaritima ulvae]QEG40321.1 hypothetical protein UC8_23280 [Roseimaritima ulvae]
MRLNIHTAVAFAALAIFSAGVASAQTGEYIVDSQIVSDEVVGGTPTGSQYVGDLSSGSVSSYEGEVVVGSGMQNRRPYGQPDLFYNYYTQGYANRVNAQMYVSPLPVPPNVGHTYTTYQPFMPHEMLYAHKDKFHNYYDNGRGMNRTKVNYSYPHVRTAAKNFYWNVLRIPR